MKKVLKIVAVMIIAVISLGDVANGSYSKFVVMDEQGDKEQLENNQGYISKSVVSQNEAEGKVEIEIKISNTTEKVVNEKTEIIFLLDNSYSMREKVGKSSKTKKQTIISAMETLVNKIYEQNPNVYMGLVRFSTNANVMCRPVNKKQNVLSAVNSLKKVSLGDDTKIDVGLNTANSLFSSNAKNKILVLLTDGISYVSETRAELQKVDRSGTNLISMVTGLTANEKATQAFGTPSRPTAGTLYNIENTNISAIMQNDMFNDIMEKIPQSMNNIVLTDYFPEEIVKHFEFQYTKSPNYGSISQKISEANRSITWNISKLNPKEVATVRYSLKLKDMENHEIMNKIIPTNEKVDVSYTDYQGKQLKITLEESPKVELQIPVVSFAGTISEGKLVKKEVEQQPVPEVKDEPVEVKKEEVKEKTKKTSDTTTAKEILPHTGNNKGLLLIILGVLVARYAFYRKNKLKDSDVKVIRIR